MLAVDAPTRRTVLRLTVIWTILTFASISAFSSPRRVPTYYATSIRPTTAAKTAASVPTVLAAVKTSPSSSSSSPSSSTSASTQQQDDKEVITDFQSWFKGLPKSNLHPSIEHVYFGKLRGLSWTALPSASSLPSTPVVSVPLSVVLQSNIFDTSTSTANEQTDDWDVTLAQQLWKECQKGSLSPMSGYCSFLTQNMVITSETVPPSTASNALRHWTLAEREVLKSQPAGQKLLQLEQEQQTTWKRKYQALQDDSSSSNNNNNNNNMMSWEQFQWAMEVVHSRAFRGNFGSNHASKSLMASSSSSSSSFSLAFTLLPTLGATVGGWIYTQTTIFPSDLVLPGLAMIAVLPLLLNVFQMFSTPPSAVLLPMIDSANHKQSADSSIEYDPLSQCFQMSIGPKCLVTTTTGGLQQLCISYGVRSDAELLLNYGFVTGEECTNDAPISEQRERLAKAFLEGQTKLIK